MDMREHAESLARQGFRVLPLHTPEVDLESNDVFCSCRQPDCKSVGKHPRNKSGLTDATADLEKVGEWWRMWPTANIGVATGYEFDVLDIDGPDGLRLYNDYAGRFGVPKHERGVLTGREFGLHLYVEPGGLKAWTGGFAGHPIGLDVKGKGGYVVAPPSLHESGRRYTWMPERSSVYTGDGQSVSVEWQQWHDAVIADCAPVRVRQPSANSTSGVGFAGTVKSRVYGEVVGTPEGGRWQAFSTIGIMDVARLIKGNEIGHDDGVKLLVEIADALGLDEREHARIPAELERAVQNVHTPIQRRAVAETPGYTSSPGYGALTAADGGQLDVDPAERERLAVESQTAYYRVQMKARDAAKESLRREEIGARPDVVAYTLDELLALPDEPTKYRLDGVWPVGSRIMLAAQFKAGKTTLVGNVVRSLVDGSAFLNRFASLPPDGNIHLVDTEMNPQMLKSWLRDQAISNTEKVRVTSLRGLCSSFDITDPVVRTSWAEKLRKADTEILILDCLGPILAALGLDENNNQDIGKFISAFEALLEEAGIADAMIIHHMGHFGERSRGASRLRDWPDVEWHLIRDGQEDDKADVAPDALRFFRAYGRDVSVPEQLLHYDSQFRWLSVNGDGSRKAVRENRANNAVEAFVKANPGASQSAIEAKVTGKAVYIRSTLRELIAAGTVVVVDGPNKSKMHFHRDYVPNDASGA